VALLCPWGTWSPGESSSTPRLEEAALRCRVDGLYYDR
jgi:hypothetical protein